VPDRGSSAPPPLTAPPQPTERLPRPVFVLAAVAFCVAAGFGIVAPAIPTFARTFGVGSAAAAAVVSVFAGVRLVSAPAAGRLVDRRGERTVMVTGLVVVAVSSALAGLSRDYVELLLLRGLGGFGSALFSTSATALLVRSVPSRLRGRASGTFSAGFLLGGIGGPALGGIVTAISPRLPFFLYAATLAVATGVALVFVPVPAPPPLAGAAGHGGTAAPRTTLRVALRLTSFRAVLATNFADNWGAVGSRAALVPLLVAEVLHRSPTVTGAGFAVFSLANALALPVATRLDRRGYRHHLLVAGPVVSAIGAVFVALPIAGTGALVLFFLGLFVFGAGSGLLDVAPAAVLGDVLPATGGGSLVAAYQMSGDLGSTTGPLVAGLVAEVVGLRLGLGLSVVVLAAAAAVASPLLRGGRGPAGESAEGPPVLQSTPSDLDLPMPKE
jgi:MFS family permease